MIISHSRRHTYTATLSICCLTGACILLLVCTKQALSAASDALALWWTRVLPALFPFYVLTSMLCRLNVFSMLQRRFGGAFLPCLLLGGVAGTPNGARVSVQMRREEYAALCNLASPMFLLGVVAVGMCENRAMFWPLAIAHYGSAILLMPVCRALTGNATGAQDAPPAPAPQPGSLFSDIGDGMRAMLGIGGCIVFFYVLADTAASALFGGRFPGVAAVVIGMAEMTAGCARISALPLPPRVLAGILAFLTTFGGVCIFAQVMMTTKLARPGAYLLQKLMQGCLAGCIAFLVAPLFLQSTTPAWSDNADAYAENALVTLTFVLSTCVGLVASYLTALLMKRARTHHSPGPRNTFNNRRPHPRRRLPR